MASVKKNKRITISDIATLAGVSKSTASLVLNGPRNGVPTQLVIDCALDP